MTIAGLLVGLGVYTHLRETTSVPDLFYYLFTIAVAAQMAAGWIPYTKGKKRKWHHITAWIMAFSMLPLGALLLVNSFENQGEGRANIGGAASVIGLVCVFIMATLLMWILMEGRKDKEMLRAQQVYLFCFMTILILRAYL